MVSNNSGKRLGGDHTQVRKDGEVSILKQWSIEVTRKQRLESIKHVGGSAPGGGTVSTKALRQEWVWVAPRTTSPLGGGRGAWGVTSEG